MVRPPKPTTSTAEIQVIGDTRFSTITEATSATTIAAMAVVNEGLRAWLSFDAWLTVKVWGVTILSMAFALANIPMLLRHGFSVAEVKEEPPIPPQG